MKICRRCKAALDECMFALKLNSTTKVCVECIGCKQSPARQWLIKHPDKARLAIIKSQLNGNARKGRIKKKYGITLEEYDKMLNTQEGRCKICNSPAPKGRHTVFNVDHSHSSGKIRGLLCTDCNRGLGFFKDSPMILETALKYIRA